MGIVQAQAIMSLDGFVAKPDNTIGRLFDWLQNGEVALPTPAGDFTVHLAPPSAEHWRRWVSSLGALVCGRTLFDVAEGWQGRHTLDVPVVVLTHRVPTDWVEAHPDAPFSFVTEGIEAAIARAQELAGDRVVAVAGGTIARQCLELGLLDEVAVDLVPVVMGDGNRPFFGALSAQDVLLGNPTVCVQGDRVVHLVSRYAMQPPPRAPDGSGPAPGHAADRALRIVDGRDTPYVPLATRCAPDPCVGVCGRLGQRHAGGRRLDQMEQSPSLPEAATSGTGRWIPVHARTAVWSSPGLA
jgi:dihydrofolate reductase